MIRGLHQRGRPHRWLIAVAGAAVLGLVISLLWGIDRGRPDTESGAGRSAPREVQDSAAPATTTDAGVGEAVRVQPVPVPATGAYLGAFVNTADINGGGSMEVVLGHLPEFTRQIGRNPAIVSSYQPWRGSWVLEQNLTTVADTYGAIPMVSWQCGSTTERIAAGAEDQVVTELAHRLADYGRPVLLRWYWEANLPLRPDCAGPGPLTERAGNYVAAFRHVADVFDAAGAANVAFVWSPSSSELAEPMELYYPGDDHVDWIGVDGYDSENGVHGFAEAFEPWYRLFAEKGKPMIITETGSTTNQAVFLGVIGDLVPREYQQVKAIVYFDAVGTVLDRRLTSSGAAGLAAFAALGREPWFAVMPPEGT